MPHALEKLKILQTFLNHHAMSLFRHVIISRICKYGVSHIYKQFIHNLFSFCLRSVGAEALVESRIQETLGALSTRMGIFFDCFWTCYNKNMSGEIYTLI